jgi:hypothetical protein
MAGEEGTAIAWYKPEGATLGGRWVRHVIDGRHQGSAHDMLFADMDGDGARELVAIAAYTKTPGIFIYKPGADPTEPWQKHAVSEGHFADGTCVADLDGDGQLEIVSGPAWYDGPAGGPYAGGWTRRVFAPPFREMCRTSPLDITGNGRPDLVIAEAEYVDGLLSWFENRLGEQGEQWVEHRLLDDLQYAHSLHAWTGGAGPHVFVAEMASGGWGAPYNQDARLLQFDFHDGGRSCTRRLLYRGTGTHEAVPCDIDGDGVWEIAGKEWKYPKVHLYKRRERPSPLSGLRHRMLDLDKPYTSTDVIAVDVDGDGRTDVATGAWWYRNPDWTRFEIPGVFQVHCAYDLDGDGRDELIATKRRTGADPGNWYTGLCSELCWLKAVDPANGRWEEHAIGTGSGDWPHGSLVAPVLPGGRPALVTAYHNAGEEGPFPEIWPVPDDPADGPWERRVVGELPHREEVVAHDMTGDGLLDLVFGPWWLENNGDGTFTAHVVCEGFEAARVRVADVNGDGRPDIVIGEEVLDYPNKRVPYSRVAWFECPEDPRESPWQAHVIDKVLCPHSVEVADLDGDGEGEVIAGEHFPFRPYRSRCRLLVYKKAQREGLTWYRHVIDARFEHHDGAKLIELTPGRFGLVSIGWSEPLYVHLWAPA